MLEGKKYQKQCEMCYKAVCEWGLDEETEDKPGGLNILGFSSVPSDLGFQVLAVKLGILWLAAGLWDLPHILTPALLLGWAVLWNLAARMAPIAHCTIPQCLPSQPEPRLPSTGCQFSAEFCLRVQEKCCCSGMMPCCAFCSSPGWLMAAGGGWAAFPPPAQFR